MNHKKVVFLFSYIETCNLSVVKSLKKKYKRSNIEIVELMDMKKDITILSFEETLLSKNIDVSNIDFVTDRFDLLVTAFRIYQKQIQNFVYLENSMDDKYLEDDSILLQQLLIDFKGIDDEEICKKVYVNINDSNYLEVINKMIHLVDYISILSNLDIKEKINVEKIKNKCYWLNVEDNIYIDFESSETENIKLYKKRIEGIERFREKDDSLDIQVLAYYIMHQLNNKGIKEYLNQLKYLSNILRQEQFILFEAQLIKLIDDSNFTPESKSVLYQLLFEYPKELHEELYNKIIKLVYSNELNWKYWKSLMVLLCGSKFKNELIIDDDIYKTTKEVNIAISEIIEKQQNLQYKIEYEKDNKQVVILIDQLLSLHHAPTNVLKVQLEQLLLKTDYEYHIVIEENMIQPIDEYALGFQKFVGNESTYSVHKFKELFQTDRVKLYLVNKDSDISTRVKQIGEIVCNINPKLIFSLSSFSTAQNILYKYFPTINFSLGHEYLPTKAHLYLYKNDKRAIELNNKFHDTSNIKHYRQPSIQIPSTENYKRSDFSYEEDDYIVITSGNRIEFELDNQLIDLMRNVLGEYKKIKWLLVGSNIPKYLLETYDKQIIDNQIKHISYEKDLIALNRICNLSINPNRVGGGYSVSSCIEADIPVLMCKYESDGMAFLGEENTCGETYEDLIKCLINCYKDSNYYEEILSKQRPNIQKRRIDNTDMLLQYFTEVTN